MLIKFCGLNPTRDVQQCINLGVNFLGFIFYEKSPRHLRISDLDILNKYNKKKSSYVIVTVDANNEFINKIKNKNLDYIQLHGSENHQRIEEIKKISNLKIIKTIKIKSKDNILQYKKFDNADIILFDTPSMENSSEFPMDLIKNLPKGKRFALAGSISENNIKNIAKLGVKFFDLSSNLESKLGFKDPLKIKNFMNKINEIND